MVIVLNINKFKVSPKITLLPDLPRHDAALLRQNKVSDRMHKAYS
jgi:hypothetical protein